MQKYVSLFFCYQFSSWFLLKFFIMTFCFTIQFLRQFFKRISWKNPQNIEIFFSEKINVKGQAGCGALKIHLVTNHTNIKSIVALRECHIYNTIALFQLRCNRRNKLRMNERYCVQETEIDHVDRLWTLNLVERGARHPKKLKYTWRTPVYLTWPGLKFRTGLLFRTGLFFWWKIQRVWFFFRTMLFV